MIALARNLGVSLETVGRTEEAFQQFNRAAQIDPSYPEAQCNLGRTLAQRGQCDDAIAHLTQAMRLKPNYENAKQQLRKLGIEPEASGLTQTGP